MANKSKARGTGYETECKKLINRWCPSAKCERVVLHGNKDHGDLRFMVDDLVVCAEAKWRKSYPGETELQEFQRQTVVETKNSGADVGVLFVNRYRLGTHRSEAWMRVDWLMRYLGFDTEPTCDEWVCMPMAKFLTMCFGQPAWKE